ncbi:MAG: LysM peptidoglycan-binding domain-containing protein [Chloroflexi bacterium]|nr:LysM peptidoglycan-binding domain-containing protein [Chloroflexota bacterium]
MKARLVNFSPCVLIAAFVFALLVVFVPTTTLAQGPYGNPGGFMPNVQPMFMPGQYAPSSSGTLSRYVVQPGDTLYGIARRFGVSVNALMSVNRIFNPNYIFVGMVLFIPGGYVPPSPHGTYIVQFGDTLTRIALRFRTSVYALMIANHIPNPNLIFAGMRLIIPSGYPSPQPFPTSIPGPTPTPRPDTANVTMQNTVYSPQSITVKVGTTVVWRNTETNGMEHTVTSGAPNAPSNMFDSGAMNPGQTFQFTFTTPGTFGYYCRIHPTTMTGIVVVTQ